MLLVLIAEFDQDWNDHSSFVQIAIVFESRLIELAICSMSPTRVSTQFSKAFPTRQVLSFFDDSIFLVQSVYFSRSNSKLVFDS